MGSGLPSPAERFPQDCWLDVGATGDPRERLAGFDIVGGSVYDALVGCAAANQRTLLTRARRAERIYRAPGVD